LVVDQRAGIHWVREYPMNLGCVPKSAASGPESVTIQPIGNQLLATLQMSDRAVLNELPKNPPNRFNFFLVTWCQGNPLILNALLLIVLQDVDRTTGLVQKQAIVSIRWVAADPIALFGDGEAAVEDLDAQFLAGLGGTEPFKLKIDR